MTRYRWVVLAVGTLGTAALSGLRQGLPALGPALRTSYGLDLSRLGLVFASVSAGIMLTLVPWGALSDRVGERVVMSVGLAGAAVVLGATAFAGSFEALLAGLFVAGMLGASATGASGRAVMGWFGRRERGFALGIRQMAIPLGGAVAALTLPALVSLGGLRAAFLALAGTCLAAAGVAAVLMREPAPTEPPAGLAPSPPPTRDRRIWRLGAGSGLLVIAQGAITGFVVIFLHDQRGLSAGAAAAGLAAIALGGGLARLVAGRRSDTRERRIAPMRRLALLDAALVGATAVLVDAPGALLYPVLLAAGMAAMSWNGLAFTAAAEISGRRRAGTAMSLQNTIISAGGVGAPIAFGALVGASSWRLGYALVAFAPLAGWWVLGPLEGEEDDRARARAQRLSERPRTRPGARSCNPTGDPHARRGRPAPTSHPHPPKAKAP